MTDTPDAPTLVLAPHPRAERRGLSRLRTPFRSPLRTSGVVVLLVVLLACLAFAAVTWVRVSALVTHLEEASTSADAFVTALTDDPESARAHLDEATAALDSATEDLAAFPVAQAAWLPWLGENVAAVETVVAAFSDVATTTGPTVAEAALLFDFSAPEAGAGSLPSLAGASAAAKEDLGRAATVLVTLPDAVETLRTARDDVAAVDTSRLLPPVRDAIEQAQGALESAYSTIEPAAAAFGELAGRIDTALRFLGLGDTVDGWVEGIRAWAEGL